MKKAPVKLSNIIFGKLHRHYTLWRSVATKEEAYAYNRTNRVLLTFDDDGTPENIRGILTVLAQENVKAFFFIKGDWAAARKQNVRLTEEMKEQGHWVGSHSYNHVYLDQLSDSEVEEQLTKGLQTKYMRPPYGAYDARVRRIAHKLGFKISYWTVDSFDWKGISVAEIQENVLSKLHKGACVLLHLNTPHTLEALPGLIAGIRERGYELCFEGNEVR